MRKIFSFIFKQYDIGQWWGAFSQTLSQVMGFITLFNTALLIPTAYVTWFFPWTSNMGLKISFTVFVSIIFVGSVLVLLGGFKILVPSNFSFWADQFWRYKNPIEAKLDKMQKRLDRIEKKLENIKR
jgi:uncharacterized membrane protein HdeD (DUF308 family)